MSGRLRTALGLAVTLALLVWVLRGVDPSAIWLGIRSADPFWFFGSIALATAGLALRAERWRIFLGPVHPGTRFGNRLAAVSIGFMGNNLLPARAGELARVLALTRLEGVPVGQGAGTLVVERFLDAVAILLLLLLALVDPGFPSEVEVMGRPVGVAVGFASSLLGLALLPVLLLLFLPGPSLRVVDPLTRILPRAVGDRIRAGVQGFLAGLGSLRAPSTLLMGLFWSLGFWLWHSASMWMAFRAFGIEAGFGAALFLNAVLAFFVAVPSSPGFFGTFHAGAITALAVYAVPDERVLAFAFGTHLGGFIPVTLLGLFYAWRIGFSLGSLRTEPEPAGVPG